LGVFVAVPVEVIGGGAYDDGLDSPRWLIDTPIVRRNQNLGISQTTDDGSPHHVF
jgi:hypothetical protein